MAGSLDFFTGSTETQQAWRGLLNHEVEKSTVGWGLVSPSRDACIQLMDDLTKERGDQVQIRFSPTDTYEGIAEGDDVYSNQGRIRTLTDSLSIDWLGFSFGQDSPMSQQRVNFDLKEVSFEKARANWQRRFETIFMNHLCGYTVESRDKFVGHNAVVATDSNHLIRAGGLSTDAALAADTSAVFSLDLINDALTRCMSEAYLTYPIAPPSSTGRYCVIIHPTQWKSLRDSSTAGDWEDIQLAQVKGGKDYESTGLGKGHLGMYNNTDILVSDYITTGITSSATQANTRVAVFLGQSAGALAFGEGYASGDHLDWSEEVWQHKKWSLLVDSVFGFTKLMYNNASGTTENYGNICIHTYSAA